MRKKKKISYIITKSIDIPGFINLFFVLAEAAFIKKLRELKKVDLVERAKINGAVKLNIHI